MLGATDTDLQFRRKWTFCDEIFWTVRKILIWLGYVHVRYLNKNIFLYQQHRYSGRSIFAENQ